MTEERNAAGEGLDLDRMEGIALAAGGPDGAWGAGHLSADDHSCNCPYIFDSGCMGGIATVHVDNGLSISEGGNDGPPLEYAKAIQRHIATFDPKTVLRLIALAKASPTPKEPSNG